MRRRLRYGLSALAGVAMAAGAVATAATAIPSHNNDPLQSLTSTLQSLAGSLPSYATPNRVVGAVNPNQQLPIKLALPLRNAGQAQDLVKQLSDPSSSQYGKYLSAQQFNSQFAPTQKQVDKVSGWLKSKGLKVQGATDPNNHYVAAQGSVAQLQKAFSTNIKKYSVNGATMQGPDSVLKLPGDIAQNVQAVLGLDNSTVAKPGIAKAPVSHAKPGAGASPSAATCATDKDSAGDTYWDQTAVSNPHPLRKHESNYLCAYSPAQIRSAYGLRGATGAGQTVAIVDAYDSATLSVDANKYNTKYGLPQLTSKNFIHKHESQVDNSACTADDHQSWSFEQGIDIDAVHTAAPDATILYYGGANCTDLFGPLNSIVAHKSASIISNSYSVANQNDVPKSTVASYNNVLLQAAAEGIGTYFSTGDYGDESVKTGAGPGDGHPVTNFPATSPYATAVGGTTLAIGSKGQRLFETGWESRYDTYVSGKWGAYSEDKTNYPKGFIQGAGGGIATGFTTPSWQTSSVGKAYSRGYRTVPDVAALGDPSTGLVVGYTPRGAKNAATGPYDEVAAGGTSLAAPLVAGMVADAQHVQHRTLGFLNQALYKARGTSKLVDITHVDSDIYIGDNTLSSNPLLIDNDIKVGTQQTHAGWDNVTGVGVPNGSAFLSGIGK
ncbi:MAG TPA: S53 family peptidase [Mycobacteriales bacterium]|nr:S53 family peptidase [Mycobacteriales bacterium]